jgi:hypothetical protein
LTSPLEGEPAAVWRFTLAEIHNCLHGVKTM